MLKLLSTRISALLFGMLVVRTKSDHCGDIISRIHRYYYIFIQPVLWVPKSHMGCYAKVSDSEFDISFVLKRIHYFGFCHLFVPIVKLDSFIY
jgi:hypothetical protein